VWASSTCLSHKAVSWDAIAVIEELAYFDKRLEMGYDPQAINTEAFWGLNYFIDLDPLTK
jgi:hypothetical protein